MRLFLLAALLAMVGNAQADYNPTPTNVGVYSFASTVASATGAIILSRNIYRAALSIQNNGGTNVAIKPGSAPLNSTDGIVLVPGAIWAPTPPFVDALYAISASSTDKLIMIEGAK